MRPKKRSERRSTRAGTLLRMGLPVRGWSALPSKALAVLAGLCWTTRRSRWGCGRSCRQYRMPQLAHASP
eukprot:scaffold170789_cov18-Tisochrysis_lutea.AAC.2